MKIALIASSTSLGDVAIFSRVAESMALYDSLDDCHQSNTTGSKEEDILFALCPEETTQSHRYSTSIQLGHSRTDNNSERPMIASEMTRASILNLCDVRLHSALNLSLMSPKFDSRDSISRSLDADTHRNIGLIEV
jgi:hypothetical protein